MKVPKPRQLSSGNWFIQLRLGGASVPVTAYTEKECIAQAQLLKAEHIAHKSRAIIKKLEPVTVGQTVDNYIAAKTNILSPSTIRGYKNIRKSRFKDLMPKQIDSIAEKEWALICNQEAALCAPKTLSNAWRFLATVLDVECGMKLPKVTLPQIPPNERPFLEPEQIKPFMEAVAGTDVEIPALLALSSLRRSEICALTWDNIDLKQRRIKVAAAMVPNENGEFVHKKQTKNRASTRYVPIMMDELLAVLESVEQKEGLVLKKTPDAIWQKINRLCEKKGFAKVGMHGLRHSFASLAYHLQVPEKIVMEIGGWADSQTMHKIYTHIAKSDMSRYETQMTNFFKNANKER